GNAAELFALCSYKSTRNVEELLAARFPKPDIQDSIRRLPAPRGVTSDVRSANALSASTPPISDAGSAADSDAGSADAAVLNSAWPLTPDAGSMAVPAAGLEPDREEAEWAARPAKSGEPSSGRPVAIDDQWPAAPRRRQLEPLSADRFGVRFT